MTQFEVVDRFADAGLSLPARTTQYAAGYDMQAAEDVTIPPYQEICSSMNYHIFFDPKIHATEAMTLDEMADFTKRVGKRPTLVSTGMKVRLEPNQYLKLVSRSSLPQKDWLVLANGVGKRFFS